MLPILFSIGPLSFRTFNLFLIVAYLCLAFLFWRKGKEEHYDEAQLFDGFLLSTLFGFVVGRFGFILTSFDQFGLNILKWLDIFSQPGVSLLIGMAAATIYMYRYAMKQKWDAYELVDFWVTSLSFCLGVIWLGLFFDGSSFGYATQLPWGITFPGVFTQHHPVQIYYALFFFILYKYLSWVEYRYRTYSWYRSGKNTAQTGFLTSVFILATGFYSLIMALVQPGTISVGGFMLDPWIYLLMTIGGGLMLWVRSGRNIPIIHQKRTSLLKKYRV